MVIEWKEREHGEEDEQAMENEICMNALRNCGLILPNTLFTSSA